MSAIHPDLRAPQKQMPDEPPLVWLRQLIHERISTELSLRIVGQPHARYCLSRDELAIEMPVWEWGLGKIIERHSHCDLEAQGWRHVVGKPLPAPGVGGFDRPVIEAHRKGFAIHYDILGFAYWMLSRSEEVGREDLDEHGRFPATSSHAYRHGYLDRPVVDEWLDLLRQVVQRLWPGLKLTGSGFKMSVSHDVDVPSDYAFCTPVQMLRAIGGDILKRGDVGSAIRRSRAWMDDRRLHAADPYNTFGWIMDMSERRGLTSAFYFVCGRTEPSRDPRYEVDSPAIRALIRLIHRRRHEIGLHPSYDTYLDADAIKREAQTLFRVCSEEGVSQHAWGGRMHYLRWSNPITPHAWQDAGMTYDTTLGYADLPGFRCGTCFEYMAIDPVARQPLELRIRPLIAMDVTVLAQSYMGLGATPAARDEFTRLKDRCRSVGGSFALLWHNNLLATREQRDVYQTVLDA